MQKYYTTGANYWGRASDANGEDTLHNEMYFDQFLAWFGMATLSGTNSNILYDIANPPPASIHHPNRQVGLVRVRQGMIEVHAQAQTHIVLLDLQGRQVWQTMHQNSGAALYPAPKGIHWVQLKHREQSRAFRVAVQ